MFTEKPVDRLSALLERFRLRAHWFHAGPLCGMTPFPAKPGRGFLHVLRHGDLAVTHAPKKGLPKRLSVNEPSLLFYPRPVTHCFHNAPEADSDFSCAALDFDGGERNPILRALPDLVVLPIAQVEGLAESLELLFAETAAPRCGQRVLADRLFEIVVIQLLRWMIDHPAETGMPSGLMTGLSDPRLARALVAVHESPERPWTLPSMAQTAGMSRSAFAARFKSVLAQSPADYLIDWRLSLVQERLRAGDSVARIADQFGYANPSALSRVFRQKLGTSPREWLRSAAG